jgi:hypothetical protein
MRFAMKRLTLFGVVAMIILTAAFFSACKGKTGAPAEAESLSLEAVTAVVGKAGAEISGASELTKTADGYEINYHLYLAEQQDFDGQIGADLAPKVEKLYKAFPSLDKVTFSVETPDPSNTAEWRLYCSFDMTRQIYKQLDWTNLLAQDLFKVCKVTYPR